MYMFMEFEFVSTSPEPISKASERVITLTVNFCDISEESCPFMK